MFNRTYLILLCAVCNLLIFSAGEYLNCKNTVEALPGTDLILNCSLIFKRRRCESQDYNWGNTNNSVLCDTDTRQYSCGWDKHTYVSLKISDVRREENYTVTLLTTCGLDDSTIHVRLKALTSPSQDPQKPLQDTNMYIYTIPGVAIICIVITSIYFWRKARIKKPEAERRFSKVQSDVLDTC